MKINIYTLFFIAFIIIVILHFFTNAMQEIEEFTPSFREVYRPYIRKARIVGEGFYVHHKTNISNLFRKFGIM
jgi:hypothetical protein